MPHDIPSHLEDSVIVKRIPNIYTKLDKNFQGGFEVRFNGELWFTLIGKQGKGFAQSQGWNIITEQDAIYAGIEKITDVFATKTDACKYIYKLIELWQNDNEVEQHIINGIGF